MRQDADHFTINIEDYAGSSSEPDPDENIRRQATARLIATVEERFGTGPDTWGRIERGIYKRIGPHVLSTIYRLRADPKQMVAALEQMLHEEIASAAAEEVARSF